MKTIRNLCLVIWLTTILAIIIELCGGVHMSTTKLGPLNAIEVSQTAHVWGVEYRARGLGMEKIGHCSWGEYLDPSYKVEWDN